MTGRLILELLSDACFSMPAGTNVTVDVDACTDALGLPAVPGKTLHGLLRDTWLACSPRQEDWEEYGYRLLGRPKEHGPQGLLRIGKATLGTEIRDRIQWAVERTGNPMPREAVRDAFFGSRMFTAINRGTGAPATDTLRGVRIVPQGTVLYAPVRALGEMTSKDKTFLDFLLRATRHVGLDRNRGLGYVRMRIEWESTSAMAVSEVRTTGKVELLHYRIALTAPCVLHSRDLDPNSCETLGHIPGSALRGAVAAVLERSMRRHQEGTPARSEIEKALVEIVQEGKARFLAAYPEAEEQEIRSRPTPITWQRDKGAEYHNGSPETFPSNAAFTLFAGDSELADTQRQPLRAGYVATDRARYLPIHTSAYQERNTHQTRFRERGIAQPGQSTVYVYEAIKAGTTLRGCIAAPLELHATLKEILESGDLLLGRSARAQYGGVPVCEVLSDGAGEDELQRSSLGPIEAGDRFELHLTAPALVRDLATGQFDPWQLGSHAEALFEGKARTVATCVKSDESRGYVRQWRTELPRLPAAGAGSIVLFEACEDIPGEWLWTTQLRPLGERIEDGYGAFVVLSHFERLHPIPLELRTLEVVEPSEDISSALLDAQTRLYDAILQRLLAARAVTLADRTHAAMREARRRLPSASLFQRMRTPLRTADWEAMYRTWFAAPAGDGNRGKTESDKRLRLAARQPIERLMIDGKPLNVLLLAAADARWPNVVADREEEIRRNYRFVPEADANRIWAELLARRRTQFLDRLLSRFARHAQEEEA